MCSTVMKTFALFVGSILGGFISAGTGIFLFWWQRRRAAKDEFFAFLADQRTNLDEIDRLAPFSRFKNEDAFYSDSVSAMIKAVNRVRPFITERQWLCMDKIRKEYQSHKENSSGLTRANEDAGTGILYTSRLRDYFDRLAACCNPGMRLLAKDILARNKGKNPAP